MVTQPAGFGLTRHDDPTRPGATDWRGDKVRLRNVETGDHSTLAGLDRRSANLGGGPEIGGHRYWAAHRNWRADSEDSHLAIDTLHSRILVGSVSLQTDPGAGLFSYSIGISPLHRRCGYASDAVSVLLANLFAQRRLHTCEITVHGGNLGSLSLHGVLGFRETERVWDAEVSRGSLEYMVKMSLTAPEFAARVLGPSRGRSSPRGRRWRFRRGRHWSSPQRSLML